MLQELGFQDILVRKAPKPSALGTEGWAVGRPEPRTQLHDASRVGSTV